MAITNFTTKVNLFYLDFFESHVDNWNSSMPPQSLLFSKTEVALTFLKTSSVGIMPSRSLNDRFRFYINSNRTKNLGILAERLF